MTRIETSRVKEVLGMNVASVQEAASRLTATGELQDLEAQIAELEKTISELKSNLAGLPFKNS